jgi:hypothetical protein
MLHSPVALTVWMLAFIGPSVQQPPLHVLKIVGGPSGAESDGTFVFQEERSVFNRAADREVIVYFLWDGTPGPHKMVGHWRSPDGGQASMSTIDYVAKERRFAAYWRLPISPGMTLGTWSIEASVDGQPAGRFTFEITDQPVAPAPVKRALSHGELFERLNRVFVLLHRTNASGRDLDVAAGLAGARGLIYTAMAAIDDVDRVRAVLPGATSQDVSAALAWHRRHEWAVLESSAGRTPAEPLAVAAAEATRVGDRCFSMEGGLSGGRSLVEGAITGMARAAADAPMFLATFSNGVGTPGAPVLNEYGELIGIIGAGTPGATRLYDLLRLRAQLRGTPIVPFSLVRLRPDAPAVPLAELRARHELIAALWGEEHVQSGGFARSIGRSPVGPVDQRDDFSARDKSFVIFVTWNPVERLRGLTKARLYDADNRIIVESKPKKSDLRKRQPTFSVWEMPATFAPGSYRAEILLDDRPMWRGFVQITP